MPKGPESANKIMSSHALVRLLTVRNNIMYNTMAIGMV